MVLVITTEGKVYIYGIGFQCFLKCDKFFILHACQPLTSHIRSIPENCGIEGASWWAVHWRYFPTTVIASADPGQPHLQLQCVYSALQFTRRLFKKLFLFIWLCWGLSCSMQDLVPWLGIKPGPHALGMWSLSLWTTREVLQRVLVHFSH